MNSINRKMKSKKNTRVGNSINSDIFAILLPICLSFVIFICSVSICWYTCYTFCGVCSHFDYVVYCRRRRADVEQIYWFRSGLIRFDSILIRIFMLACFNICINWISCGATNQWLTLSLFVRLFVFFLQYIYTAVIIVASENITRHSVQ